MVALLARLLQLVQVLKPTAPRVMPVNSAVKVKPRLLCAILQTKFVHQEQLCP